MPVSKERFDSVVAGSKGSVASVVASPQLEWYNSMWRGRCGLSMPLISPTTLRASASFTMVESTCCVCFRTVAAPSRRSRTNGALEVIRTKARAAEAACADGGGRAAPATGTSLRMGGKR